LAVATLVPGVIIAATRPANALGWLLCLSALACALAGAGREYLAYGFLGGTAPGYLWLGWFTDALYFVSMCALPVALMLFPDGRPLSRRSGWLLAVPLAALLIGTPSQLFVTGNDVDVQGRTLTNPAGHLVPSAVTQAGLALATLAFYASIVIAVIHLVLRYRRSGTDVRQQMKWVVWAGSIGVIELATEMIPGNQLSQYSGPVASGLVSASLCIAIVRHRLFDIDLVINRTLVFAVLSAGVIGLYVAVVAVAGAAFDEPVPIGPGLIAAAVVALAFGPARSRLQSGVDRLLYGERRTPFRAISQLGLRLETVAGPRELRVVAETVVRALRVPYAAIIDLSGRTLAEHGTIRGQATVRPLTYQANVVGQLMICPRHSEDGFGRADQQLLDELSRPIGAALHAVQLSEDLKASRIRLVSAKEEERRRLRRDLHDGLGPKLAALGLKVDAAHALADDRLEDSKQLLRRVKDEIRTTIDDIRRLVYGLRPPALDELGLVEALREATTRFDQSPHTLKVGLEAPDELPPLPAAVEVAAYWIATEAITNVVRHSGARRADVSLQLSPDNSMLEIRVADNGAGLRPDWRPGVGTASMRERAEEVGGRFSVRSGDVGGTEVCAHLPIEVAS
jgi:signal transduction histidine kinase